MGGRRAFRCCTDGFCEQWSAIAWPRHARARDMHAEEATDRADELLALQALLAAPSVPSTAAITAISRLAVRDDEQDDTQQRDRSHAHYFRHHGTVPVSGVAGTL